MLLTCCGHVGSDEECQGVTRDPDRATDPDRRKRAVGNGGIGSIAPDSQHLGGLVDGQKQWQLLYLHRWAPSTSRRGVTIEPRAHVSIVSTAMQRRGQILPANLWIVVCRTPSPPLAERSAPSSAVFGRHTESSESGEGRQPFATAA